MGEAIYVIQDSEQASTLLQPLRLRILELASSPASATSLAPALGVPRQHVNYHLRELERAGFVEFVEERKRGNCVERLYRSVARSYVVAPAALTGVAADPSLIQDRASSDYLVALGSRLIQEVSEVRSESATSPTLAIETTIDFASATARAEFAQELAGLVSDLARKYHHPGGEAEPFRMVIAVHKSPDKFNKRESRDAPTSRGIP
jgi:DNA-binding transcriptional ArsR family regulator